MRILAFVLLAVTSMGVSYAHADVIIDNGGGGTSSTGTWAVSGATGSYGSVSVWARDGAKYTWSFTPTLSGNYQVSMWWTIWPSRSTAVPVDIQHSGGTARVTVNQQVNGGKWNTLATYSLIGGVTYTVTVTSQPGPSSTCADAVMFAYLGDGGNQPPIARNDTVTTTTNAPVTIHVLSNDTDDGEISPASLAIVNPPASGTAVPDGSGSVTYTPSGGVTGMDTFTYTVADGQGAVSNTATVTVTVNDVSTEMVIDNGGPGTSFTGVWQNSGASNPYGVNSVWARDGAKYKWTFTPALSGNYQVSMWWTTLSSRSTAVPVDIQHSGGTARVTVNQQVNGGKWNTLATYSLIGGATYTVTVTSQPGPSSTCADAVQLAYLGGGGNRPPVASNDSASTTTNMAVTIHVISNDTDDVGIDAASVTIVSAPANGTAVSNGNGMVTYTPDFGFIGSDPFTYTVADVQGTVSNPATVTVTVNAVSTEVVFDTGVSGTSYTGSWPVSGATGSYGKTSLWSRDGATYTWSFTPAVSGKYDVSMWWTVWPSRSASIPVDIQHAGGTTRVTINQQEGGGRWNGLASHSFSRGVRYTVKITSQPGPTSTCVDAIRFTYVGAIDNKPPTAVIDFLSPNPAVPGAKVDISGHGVETDGGEIFAYSWRSSIDGALSTSASFNTSTLSAGQHTVYFKVQDDMGTWSTEVSASLGVINQVPSLVLASVDSGNRHSLALMNDGTVRAWGSNKEGALGLGSSFDNSLIPVQITGLTGISAISAGDGHSLALKNEGTIMGWGQNIYGGVGYGDNLTHYTPVNVFGLTGVTAISAGGLYSIALKNDGTVWAWGKNDVGQLGDGTAIHRTTPVQVTVLSGVMAISAGQDHTLVLKNDGTVWAWGVNDVGQLGDGTAINRSVPVQVSGLDGVHEISAGEAHSLALLNDGTVKAWGGNFFGELGDGTTTRRYVPVSVIGLTDVATITAGGYFSVALKNDGTVWTWGSGIDGQLGDGTNNIPKDTPVQVKGPGGIGYLDGVSSISASQDHTLAPRSNGTAWAWGYNGFGQIGDGTTTTRLTPVPATGL